MKRFIQLANEPGFDKAQLFILLMVDILVLVLAMVLHFVFNKQLDGVAMIISAFIGAMNILIGFKYGSSQGSKDKQKIIDNISKQDNG
ncbi:MAG: hypothetical protein H0X33_14500 [Taibaiella sp.]|nr:hypothetical protein [Taibaiella sp.]